MALSGLRYAAVAPQTDELPGRGEGANRHLDQGRYVAPLERAVKRGPELARSAGALGGGSKAFRKAHEVRIGKVARDQPVAVALLLVAAHVAEGTIGKDDRGQGNPVADRGSKLVRREHEAAVARN